MARDTDRLAGFFADERGMSTQIGYVLSAAIAAILISVLISGTTGMVQNQQNQAASHELKVVGERLSTQLQAADRLAVDSDPGTNIEMSAETPPRVAGKRYSVTLQDGATASEPHLLILETQDEEVRVEVPVRLNSEVSTTTLNGGDLDVIREDIDSDGNNEITIERNQ